jgi:hypothetical protein
MSTTMIGIDIGYSSTKVEFQGKVVKFPTAVSYASDVGIVYGEDNIYEFEGENYYVGKEAVSEEAFVTTDFKFLYKFAPIIIYHILSKFDEVHKDKPIEVRTGLAIVDWAKKDDFAERIGNFTVNGVDITTQPVLIPQGAGVAQDWVINNNEGKYPDRLHILDIGFNTINSLHFEEGKPSRAKTKTYPGHGVSSIIKPFTSYVENRYAMNFSEQEAIGIFIKGSFKYNGEEQPELSEKIIELKAQFVKKLFQSVLVNDKKTMAISDVVLIAGGGAYLLQDVPFPPNVEFVDAPYEFSNVVGYTT